MFLGFNLRVFVFYQFFVTFPLLFILTINSWSQYQFFNMFLTFFFCIFNLTRNQSSKFINGLLQFFLIIQSTRFRFRDPIDKILKLSIRFLLHPNILLDKIIIDGSEAEYKLILLLDLLDKFSLLVQLIIEEAFELFTTNAQLQTLSIQIHSVILMIRFFSNYSMMQKSNQYQLEQASFYFRNSLIIQSQFYNLYQWQFLLNQDQQVSLPVENIIKGTQKKTHFLYNLSSEGLCQKCQSYFTSINQNMEGSQLPNSVRLIFYTSQFGLISQVVPCRQGASFSCLITMGYYMCQNYPDILPPDFPQNLKIDESSFTLEQRKDRRAYLQPWCDYFNKLIDEKNKSIGQITEKEATIYLFCRVKEDYFNQIRVILDQNIFKQFQKKEVQNFLNQTKYSKKQKLNIGIINFAHSQLKVDLFIPKVNLLSLYTGIWYKYGDLWSKYDVLKGEYPTQAEMLTTDIFILSGSTTSVNDNNPHIEKTMQILKKGLQKNNKLKLLGLCFGHQAISKCFGGKVEKRNLFSGIEIIKFNQKELDKFNFFGSLKKLNDQGYLLFQFHSDYVVEAPHDFTILASSQSCQNQVMISNDGRCLSFQYHTQYTHKYIKDFQVRIRKHFKQDLYKTDYTLHEVALQKYGMQRHHQSFKAIRELVRQFIQKKVSIQAFVEQKSKL